MRAQVSSVSVASTTVVTSISRYTDLGSIVSHSEWPTLTLWVGISWPPGTSSHWSWCCGTLPQLWDPVLTVFLCVWSVETRWMDHISVQSARYHQRHIVIRSSPIIVLQFPLCGETCADKRIHKAECQIFSKLEKKVNFSNLSEKHPIYTTITPLRKVLIIIDSDFAHIHFCS